MTNQPCGLDFNVSHYRALRERCAGRPFEGDISPAKRMELNVQLPESWFIKATFAVGATYRLGEATYTIAGFLKSGQVLAQHGHLIVEIAGATIWATDPKKFSGIEIKELK